MAWSTRILSKIRILVLGILVTFLVATFYGVSLLQDRTCLSHCPCLYAEAKQSNSRDDSQELGKNEHIHHLCVLVPFKDRFEELMEFAPTLHKFLLRQNVKHKIVIINQVDGYRFNRASLINVGFLETRSECDYIAMHDVDLMPMNDELSYAFPEKGPFHVAAPHLHPLYHYKTFVGGILLLQSKHFEMLNGLSNRYWGWGREDDEFYVRIRKAKLEIHRPGNLTTGYKTFQHIHDRKKRPRDHDKFFEQREKTKRLDKETGISTIDYSIDSEKHLTIEEAPVTVFNVYLKCNVDSTPWCLRESDHAWFFKRQEELKRQKAE